MKSSLLSALAVVALCASSPVSAHVHSAATITGKDIQLTENSHAFAGSILGAPVFGVFEHVPFGASIQIRRDEKTLKLDIAEDASGNYLGSMSEARELTPGTKTNVDTKVEFVKFAKTGALEGTIQLKIDGQDVVVTVTGKKFDHNHFQEPRFQATLGTQTLEWNFTGESCPMYSTNIAMMILGAYSHLSK